MVAAAILLAAMGLYLLLDLAIAASLNPVIMGGFALVALALGLFLLDPLPGRQKLLMAGLLVTAVVAVHFVDWDSRKPFLRDFYRVQAGMTAGEVDEIMAGYLKQPSPFIVQSAIGAVQTGTITYHYIVEGRNNSDVGLVTFAGGQVVSTTYYPD
jgi:hypothetical protein